jgi:indolepyruvate decarboxylase
MELGESLLTTLERAGVKEIFGIPGDFVLPLFKVIEERCPLPLYTLCHEPAVGFAADGASRWHGNLTAAVVTYGAGALNMVNPVAAAYAEKSPVVVISGGPGISEDHTELLLHHQAKRLDSQFEIYREVTCAQTRLSDLMRAESEIERVLSECRRQSRPVYIEVPRDLVFAPLPSSNQVATPAPKINDVPDRRAAAACVDEILDLLAAASSPVLMVGVEVRRFGLEKQVAELANRLGIPVVTSFMGRGLLVGSTAPLAGTYLGVAGDPEITDLVENSDALLMLGVILSDTNFGISKKKIDLRRSIQVRDGQVSLGFHVYPQLTISDLISEIMTRDLSCRGSVVLPAPADSSRPFQADDNQMTPDDVASGLNQMVPRGEPFLLSCDIGDSLFTAMDIQQAQMIGPGYYASMGFGVPAGLGLQVASGLRPIILVGDGAFQMTGWELGNCPRYGWDPIVIVMNNASWEMLRAFQPESQFNLLNEWNFADLARGLGGFGVRVRTRKEFFMAFQSAMNQRGTFQLIEVMIERGSVSRSMDRYAKGIRAFRQSLSS